MTKASNAILIIVVAALIVGGALLFMKNSPLNMTGKVISDLSDNESSNLSFNGQETPQESLPPVSNVKIWNSAFLPQTITIKAGDNVVWTNMDTITHSVISDNGNEINSPYLDQGASYSHKFNTAGTYTYHCMVHPTMKGTVIVEEASSSSTAVSTVETTPSSVENSNTTSQNESSDLNTTSSNSSSI